MKQLINSLLNLGLNDDMRHELRSRIRLTNLLAICFLVLDLLAMANPAAPLFQKGVILFFFLGNGLVLFLNSRQLFNFSRIFLVLSAVGGMVFFNLLTKLPADTPNYGLYMIMISFFAIPATLFSVDEKRFQLPGLLLVLGATIAIPYTTGLLAPPDTPVQTVNATSLAFTIGSTVGVILICVLSLQAINKRSRQEIQSYLSEVQENNEELRQAEQELRSIQEEQQAAIQEREKMQNELQQKVQELEQTRKVDNALAEFNDLLRWQPEDSLERWSERVLQGLVKSVDGLQATLYTVGHGEGQQRELHFVGGYADQGAGRQVIPFGQGLMGQVAVSGRAFTIGEDMLGGNGSHNSNGNGSEPQTAAEQAAQLHTYENGGGPSSAPSGNNSNAPAADAGPQPEASPSNGGAPAAPQTAKRPKMRSKASAGILALQASAATIQPLLHNDKVEGVLEITALRPFSQLQLDIIQQVCERIGASLASIRSQLEVEKLYAEAQEKNQKLEQQEEELRQNIEQLNVAQEEQRQAKEELAQLNEELEARVQERTKELEETMNSLQSTQNQLVLSEKMAALGQLVAGVAHEINSPIGAVKASAGTMIELMPTSIAKLPDLLNKLDNNKTELFRSLVETILTQEPQNLSSREERKHRKRFQRALEEQLELEDDAYDIASDLIGAGYTGEIEDYLPLFEDENRIEISQALNGLGQIRLNLENINLATDKTKKTVYALKSYAHTSDSDEKVATSLRDNISTVLTIYHNQIKYGIDLDTSNLNELPAIEIYPDELSQVWTNLIQNALQAMEGEGSMKVELFQENGYQVVAIEDSGPGIPEEKQERIFEPFFTTKEKGEGTGLGLDICKKIVEKHSGDIQLASEPGRTRFMVYIPEQ
jgi:C4-dicarboxylate-specific signal transduction histidine kinase